MLSIDQITEKLQCLCGKIESFVRQNRVIAPTSDNFPIPKTAGIVIIPTGGANTLDVALPNPTVNKSRRITIVNYSGASQNILSHDSGTSLTIKTSNGA